MAVLLAASGSAHGQALLVDRLANGSELIHVTQPLSDATSVGWVTLGDDGERVTSVIAGGALTLTADVEAACAALPEGVAPPVVVAVGGAAAAELRTLLDRLLAGRAAAQVRRPARRPLVEGGVERRLGEAGSDAVLRLELPLPDLTDPRRSACEVLWELVPELLGRDRPGLNARQDGLVATLEARVDPELADVTLRRLRLDLARVAAEPRLDEGRVEAARERLRVRRQARLEAQPEAAHLLLDLWLEGGVSGLQGFLFGLEGVTVSSLREAAEGWLGQHPGAAVVVLPPQVFSPRFAPAPYLLQLDNDLSVAVLERPASPLAALCLRPVLVPDVDGRVSATVLARLAGELRTSESAPGWIRVRTDPTRLELAAPADQFAELCEVLQAGLQRVAGEGQSVAVDDAAVRRRALQLMAAGLGLGSGEDVEATDLLRPDNLALGLVAPDGEAAVEALRKFLGGWAVPRAGLESTALDQELRTRVASPGSSSALVVELRVAGATTPWVAVIVGETVRARAAVAFPKWRVETVRSLIPGRRAVLLVVEAEGRLDELESRLRRSWSRLVAPLDEATLAPLRRRAAANLSVGASGAVGRACLSAAVASGEVPWQEPAELEMAILGLSAEEVNESLAALTAWDQLLTTGAGALPLSQPAE